jgi:hypothetical protein
MLQCSRQAFFLSPAKPISIDPGQVAGGRSEIARGLIGDGDRAVGRRMPEALDWGWAMQARSAGAAM